MTGKATMPEVICDACRTINIPAKHYHALADKANKYDSLAAVAAKMAAVLEEDYAASEALDAYNALMKGR